MKIAPIKSMNFTAKNNYAQKCIFTPITLQENDTVSNYNPIYYKPQVNFKGGFESYFPTQILGYDEKSFNSLIFNAIQDPKQKQNIINYIVYETEKDHRTMEFVGIWQKAVPSLVSQGLFSNLTGAGAEDLTNRFGTQAIINNYNSAMKKFFESDYKKDILIKEGKALSTGVISSILFLFAKSDPDPQSKAALYCAAIMVNSEGYIERSKDTKKIMDKQFVDATKELMKLGVVDSYEIVNNATNNSLKLSDEKLKEYNNWKDRRILDLKYNRTGSYKFTHNDFNYFEGKRILTKSIEALAHMGFSGQVIIDYLNTFAKMYASCNEPLTNETQFLLEASLRLQRQVYEKEPIKLIDTLNSLAEVQRINEEPITARRTLREVLLITETSTPNDIEAVNQARKNLLLSNLRLILDLKEKEKLLQRDYDISITDSRKTQIKKLISLVKTAQQEVLLDLPNLNNKIQELSLEKNEYRQRLEELRKCEDSPGVNTLIKDLSSELNELLFVIENFEQEVSSGSFDLINQIEELNWNKNEYVQIFDLITKINEEHILEDFEQKLLKPLETHPLFWEVNHNDMSPELYAKFIKEKVQMVNPSNNLTEFLQSLNKSNVKLIAPPPYDYSYKKFIKTTNNVLDISTALIKSSVGIENNSNQDDIIKIKPNSMHETIGELLDLFILKPIARARTRNLEQDFLLKKDLQSMLKEAGPLYHARFLETIGGDTNIEKALSIYKKELGKYSFESIKCQIKKMLQEEKDYLKANDLVRHLSTEDQLQIKKEIANIKLGSANYFSSLMREAIAGQESYIHYYGEALEYNPSLASVCLNDIRKKRPEVLSKKEIAKETAKDSLLGVFIPGMPPPTDNPKIIQSEIFSDENVIDILLKHLNEGIDEFGINQRYLLKEKRDYLVKFFGEKITKEKIEKSIRKIESDLKFMKVK